MSRIERAVLTRWIATIAAAGVLSAITAGAVLAAASPTTVTTHQTKKGKVLAAANGHSLYLFTADKGTTSNCSGSCAATWKPLLTTGRPVAASNSGVRASLLGTTHRTGGTVQVTYKSHPLYSFSGDKKPGQISGEGANAFHGHWYLVNTSGNAVKPTNGRICHGVCQGY